ncbi:MAG: metallophosphatase family protein [Verrucomicrobia bacterium]|nr:metallophosphatase family protein [Verrucomicrobiota bacterium]
MIVVISDTHGLVRPEIFPHLKGAEYIIHAGDFGSEENYLYFKNWGLPFYTVRGNVDRGGWAYSLPQTNHVQILGLNIYMVHNLNELDVVPEAAGIDMVISGHTHEPREEIIRGVQYLNPGSAGPKRFQLPVSLATIHKNSPDSAAHLVVKIHTLLHD